MVFLAVLIAKLIISAAFGGEKESSRSFNNYSAPQLGIIAVPIKPLLQRYLYTTLY